MIDAGEVSRRSRSARRTVRFSALVVVALVVAACSGSGRAKTDTTGPSGTTASGPSGATPIIDTSTCTGDLTTGVVGDTIKIGTSLPQSGLYSAFDSIRKGEESFLDYTNANGGVTVAGKKYKLQLVAKDDAYDAQKTVTNVQSLIGDDKVFALLNVVGTKNNLAIRDLVNQECVPDLFTASGATQWGNHDYPWLIGSELVPYPLEVKAFVDYLKEKKPDATIAVLRANDDFGKSYSDTLKQLVQGTQLKIVQTQEYENTGAAVQTQVNNLAATKADAFLLAAALLACPAALNAAGDADWKPITYMSGTCASKILFGAAGANANGVLSVAPLLDPADPANANNPAMQLYFAQVKKFEPTADTSNSIVAYGWTTAALLVKTLESAEKLDRGSVMEAARTLTDVSDVGVQIPGAKWNTSADDWFVGETFQFIQYDATAGYTKAIGGLTDNDGKTASLTPSELINQ
jgi:branched-chain amino acid transport system substrate-binding protein